MMLVLIGGFKALNQTKKILNFFQYHLNLKLSHILLEKNDMFYVIGQLQTFFVLFYIPFKIISAQMRLAN